MRIHQFKLQYDPEQDRILFLLNTVTRDEFRFYLPRRFVKLLWPVLQKLLKDGYQKQAPETAHVADALLAFEKEKVMPQVDFAKQYSAEVRNFPLGEGILLLSRIAVKKAAQGEILCLLPRHGRGVELPANRKFLFSLCKVLKDVAGKAQWEVDLAESGAETTTTEPRVLH